jgi:hypothetical protein
LKQKDKIWKSRSNSFKKKVKFYNLGEHMMNEEEKQLEEEIE